MKTVYPLINIVKYQSPLNEMVVTVRAGLLSGSVCKVYGPNEPVQTVKTIHLLSEIFCLNVSGYPPINFKNSQNNCVTSISFQVWSI